MLADIEHYRSLTTVLVGHIKVLIVVSRDFFDLRVMAIGSPIKPFRSWLVYSPPFFPRLSSSPFRSSFSLILVVWIID